MTNIQCFVELDEVLKNLIPDELAKIPQDLRCKIENAKDKNYKWNYDDSKTLKEQNLNRKTIAMLSYINMKFLMTDEEKNLMEKYHELNEKKVKEYYYNKDVSSQEKMDSKSNIHQELVEITSPKWYEKILLSLKNLFSKK